MYNFKITLKSTILSLTKFVHYKSADCREQNCCCTQKFPIYTSFYVGYQTT